MGRQTSNIPALNTHTSITTLSSMRNNWSCTEDILSETLQNVDACPESAPAVLLKERWICYASTSTNSGGIGDFGCLLSKCCLKVFGSGICVWESVGKKQIEKLENIHLKQTAYEKHTNKNCIHIEGIQPRLVYIHSISSQIEISLPRYINSAMKGGHLAFHNKVDWGSNDASSTTLKIPTCSFSFRAATFVGEVSWLSIIAGTRDHLTGWSK